MHQSFSFKQTIVTIAIATGAQGPQIKANGSKIKKRLKTQYYYFFIQLNDKIGIAYFEMSHFPREKLCEQTLSNTLVQKTKIRLLDLPQLTL